MAKKTTKLTREILRKAFHLLEIPILLTYSITRFYWNEKVALLILTAILLVVLELEYIRLEVRPRVFKIIKLFRKKERNHVTGSFFFLTATIISVSTFNYGIAMLALLLTVFGDLASALIGIKFGKHKLFRQKTLEGFLGGLITNLLIGYLFFPKLPILFITMAVVASIVELFTNKLDDNITVPLFSGFAGQIIAYIFTYNMLNFSSYVRDFLIIFLP